MQTITSWLQSHGFEVGSTKGRTVLEFSGTASQVQEAFHTTIHKYLVNGEQHWANASDPQIPDGADAGRGRRWRRSTTFPAQAMNRPFGSVRARQVDRQTHAVSRCLPFPADAIRTVTVMLLGPYDFATIYNLLPLWNAGTSGQEPDHRNCRSKQYQSAGRNRISQHVRIGRQRLPGE